MGEIKREIVEREDGSVVIEEKHTLADIARWIIKNNWEDEILFLLNEAKSDEEIEKARGRG